MLAKDGLNSQIARLKKQIDGMDEEQNRLSEKIQQLRSENENEQNELRVMFGLRVEDF